MSLIERKPHPEVAAELAAVRARVAKLRRGQHECSPWVQAVHRACDDTGAGPRARKALLAYRRTCSFAAMHTFLDDLRRTALFVLQLGEELPRKGRARAVCQLANKAFVQLLEEYQNGTRR